MNREFSDSCGSNSILYHNLERFYVLQHDIKQFAHTEMVCANMKPLMC